MRSRLRCTAVTNNHRSCMRANVVMQMESAVQPAMLNWSDAPTPAYTTTLSSTQDEQDSDDSTSSSGSSCEYSDAPSSDASNDVADDVTDDVSDIIAAALADALLSDSASPRKVHVSSKQLDHSKQVCEVFMMQLNIQMHICTHSVVVVVSACYYCVRKYMPAKTPLLCNLYRPRCACVLLAAAARQW
jgi:hypothetical protein